MEMLRKHGRGIICLSGCLSAEVPTRILEGRPDEARRLLSGVRRRSSTACTWRCRTTAIEQQRRVNEGLIRLHKDTGIPLVATNDSHYTTRSDAKMHDVLLCIGTGKFYNDPKRMKFSGEEFYVKTSRGDGPHLPRPSRGAGEHHQGRRDRRRRWDRVGQDAAAQLPQASRVHRGPLPAGSSARRVS